MCLVRLDWFRGSKTYFLEFIGRAEYIQYAAKLTKSCEQNFFILITFFNTGILKDRKSAVLLGF